MDGASLGGLVWPVECLVYVALVIASLWHATDVSMRDPTYHVHGLLYVVQQLWYRGELRHQLCHCMVLPL